MRIAIGQQWQETNTFNPLPTTRADFEAFGVLRGAELIARLADTNEPGGFIQSLRAWPEAPEIVGLVRLPAWPSGTATADTLAWLLEEMTTALEQAGRVDGVLLALHGAMVSAGDPDVEGAILELMRRHIGPQVPLVASLDLHANVTRRMVESADALVLYHTAPHIDVFETGQRAAGVLRRILVEGARPVTAFQKLPLVVPAERANTQIRPVSVTGSAAGCGSWSAPPASWRPAWPRCSPGWTFRSWDRRSWWSATISPTWPAVSVASCPTPSGRGVVNTSPNWCRVPRRYGGRARSARGG
jgi:microcystin degradation protein MlrC